MKNIFTIAAVIVCSTGIFNDVKAQNLIINGSAETFDTTTLVPQNWDIVSGNWISKNDSGLTVAAYDSIHVFYEGNSPMGILQQDVNVGGYSAIIDASSQNFLFATWVQSRAETVPVDQAAVIVQCMDTTKTHVLSSWHSDTTGSVGTWTELSKSISAPPGTRYIRVQLIAIRNQGPDNDAYFDYVNLIPGAPTGINTVPDNSIVSVYPNPVKDMLYISLKNAGTYNINVKSINGQILVNSSIERSAGIDVSSLAPGMYFLQVFNEKGDNQNIKFIRK